MKRNGFDEYRDQQTANDFSKGSAACSFCGRMTENEALSQYGARCGACFTAYCTGGKPNPPMPTKAQQIATLTRIKGLCVNNGNPKAWAHKLKAREEAGELLSKPQREGWRVALGAA